MTRDYGRRAYDEMEARGLTPGQEPDRVTFEQWKAAHRTAVEADDGHRPISEADVIDEDRLDEWDVDFDESTPVVDDVDHREPGRVAGPSKDAPGATTRSAPSPARVRVAEQPTLAELDLVVASASVAVTRANDRASADVAHNDPEQDEAWAAAAEADRQRRDTAERDAEAFENEHAATADVGALDA